jgi:hypothetical protein
MSKEERVSQDKPAIAARPFHPGTPWELFRFRPDEGAGEGADTGQGQEQEEQRPEWLPDNFKSPEALAQSYREAERKLHEQAEQLKAVQERAAQADEYERYYQQQQDAQRAGDPRERFIELWEDPDRQPELVIHMAERINQLEQQVSQSAQRGPDPVTTEIAAELAQNAVRAQHEDWDTYADEIAQVVQANPHYLGVTEQSTPKQIAEGLDSVYWMVKGRSQSTVQADAAQQQQSAQSAARQQAQTLSGQGTRPPTLSDDEQYWDRVRAAESGGYGS